MARSTLLHGWWNWLKDSCSKNIHNNRYSKLSPVAYSILSSLRYPGPRELQMPDFRACDTGILSECRINRISNVKMALIFRSRIFPLFFFSKRDPEISPVPLRILKPDFDIVPVIGIEKAF
jgi:hypothetical protein